MKCEGKSTRTGEIQCPVCRATWDRGDEAPECSTTPMLDETGPGGVLNEKTMRLGLGYKGGPLPTVMARTSKGQSGEFLSRANRKGQSLPLTEYQQFLGRIDRGSKDD